MRAHRAVRDVIVLGSTGSVGTQALDVIRANPDRYRVVGLSAGGSRPALLAAQAIEFGVGRVALARGTTAQDLQLALYAAAQKHGYAEGKFALPRMLVGADAAEQLAADPADIVLNAIDGSAGLRSTLAALDAGSTLALANKESLIMGGELVTGRARPGQIVPVDSEHSALAQCLRGGGSQEVAKLVITASGGPFRGRAREELMAVTAADALAHPTWSMGPVISMNSSTLVNKGLEVIEAHLLFGVDYDRIDVVVHPQSVVHSMVEFTDGSTLAQASPPDMRLPISLALAWPERLPRSATPLNWEEAHTWTFEPVDHAAFPALRLAVRAGRAGGVAPAIYNAVNEVCVEAFLAGRLAYLGVVDTIAGVLTRPDVPSTTGGLTLDDVMSADQWARDRAAEAVAQQSTSGGAPTP